MKIQETKVIDQDKLNELLKSHELWSKSSGKKGDKIFLDYNDLSNLKFPESRIYDGTFKNCNFINTDLSNMQFDCCDLSFSYYQGTIFKNIKCINCTYENSTFKEIIMSNNIDFSNSRFNGCTIISINMDKE